MVKYLRLPNSCFQLFHISWYTWYTLIPIVCRIPSAKHCICSWSSAGWHKYICTCIVGSISQSMEPALQGWGRDLDIASSNYSVSKMVVYPYQSLLELMSNGNIVFFMFIYYMFLHKFHCFHRALFSYMFRYLSWKMLISLTDTVVLTFDHHFYDNG